MSRLFLVRHGPTHVKAMVGWTDVKADLTDAAALARLRASLPQKALMVSSDLRRAIDTADALQVRQTRLPHEMGLREMHFGDWEMKTFNDVVKANGIFFQHQFTLLQRFLFQLSFRLEFSNFLSFCIERHLHQKHFSFLRQKTRHVFLFSSAVIRDSGRGSCYQTSGLLGSHRHHRI